MVKKFNFALLIVLIFGLSSASSMLSSKENPQFLPRVQAELSQLNEIYRPARIHIEINSISPEMDELLEDLEDSAYKAAEILSEVLFVKPQNQPLKLGEENLCKGIQLENYMRLEGIEADLAVFFSISDNFIQNFTSFKVCEVSNENQLKSIEIQVDKETYKGLNEDKKASMLSRGIVHAIFNAESEKFVKEIEESLESQTNRRNLQTCPSSPCAGCPLRSSTCTSCIAKYYLTIHTASN